METYLIAETCTCRAPLEFEANRCARCGRWLVIDVHIEEPIPWWLALDAAIEKARLGLLDEAEAAGVDIDDREAYAIWLEAKMASLDVDAESYSDKVAI